jgi:hypothetical protein
MQSLALDEPRVLEYRPAAHCPVQLDDPASLANWPCWHSEHVEEFVEAASVENEPGAHTFGQPSSSLAAPSVAGFPKRPGGQATQASAIPPSAYCPARHSSQEAEPALPGSQLNAAAAGSAVGGGLGGVPPPPPPGGPPPPPLLPPPPLPPPPPCCAATLSILSSTGSSSSSSSNSGSIGAAS